MRTPYGAECRFYYADFNRGRQQQECRLIGPDGQKKWTPDLCRACPVPRLLLANACPHLVYRGRIEAGLLGLNRKIVVTASCSKIHEPVAEPAIGCGHCHESDASFRFMLR